MKILYLMLPVLLAACFTQAQSRSTISFDSLKLKQHILMLASDSFQGRKPFTEGEARTTNYITQILKEVGIKPGNNGGYLQHVPVIINKYEVPSSMRVSSKKREVELNADQDYAVHVKGMTTGINVDKGELVFAGYGITAPQFKHEDYKGISVKNKVVVILLNSRRASESFLQNGRPVTYFETLQYKVEEAERRGAKACLLVQPAGGVADMKNVQASLDADKYHLQATPVFLKAIITRQALAKILSITENFDSTIISAAEKPDFKPVNLGVALSGKIRNVIRINRSRNIVAEIPGTVEPKEKIVYSAHWDHLGIGNPDQKGDSIFNGAGDNAIGVAVLLELARTFQKSKIKPERTIVFLFPTLEEFGFLGSQEFVHREISGDEKLVANINIEGFNRYGKTKDIILIGPGRNELEEMFVNEVVKQGRTVRQDPEPAENYYFRSDHLSFAKAGIPVLFTQRGTDFLEGGAAYEDVVRKNYYGYHTYNDEYNEAWRFDGSLQDMEIYFKMGWQLSKKNVWPKWYSLSEFQVRAHGK